MDAHQVKLSQHKYRELAQKEVERQEQQNLFE